MNRFALVLLAVLLVGPADGHSREGEPLGHRGSVSNGGGLELHAHLFMKEGLGWMFNGDFFGELKATDWRNRFSSQANPATLEESGVRVCVVALYAHWLFNLSMRDSIRRQLALAHRFVAEHPAWVIATTPAEARAALGSGLHVLVLALEGSSGIIESDEDVAEFIDKGGIRIVTLLHLTDDLFGGVAFLRGIQIFANPWAAVKSLLSPQFDADGVRVNPAGLTDAGRAMAKQLIKHHVWIDLAHASDASTAELIPLLRASGQPILYTHTTLRRFLRAERGITAEELQAVRETKGVVGLMPSEDMLEGTSGEPGLPALSTQAREVGRVIGDDGVALGTDWNGGVRHLPPTSKPDKAGAGTSLDREQGYWMIGQTHELWKALGRESDPPIARFLAAWDRVFSISP